MAAAGPGAELARRKAVRSAVTARWVFLETIAAGWHVALRTAATAALVLLERACVTLETGELTAVSGAAARPAVGAMGSV